jgi:hypothetical protein
VVKALEQLFGGEPTLNAYNGEGTYDAFPSNGGGGGGGGYTPPVTPNPTYVPTQPTISITGTNTKINLISESGVVEFLENGASLGYSESTSTNYSPSSRFTGVKKYEVVKSGYNSKQYYEVSITKKYQPTATTSVSYVNDYFNYLNIGPNISMNGFYGNQGYYDNSSIYGNYYTPNYRYNIQPTVTAIDYNYTEVLTINEYRLQSDGSYKLEDTRMMDTDNGTVSLNFNLEVITQLVGSDVVNINTPQLNPIVEYEIVFSSNFKSELSTNVILDYIIFSNDGNILEQSSLNLGDGNRLKQLPLNSLNGRIDFNIRYNGLPNDYRLTDIYQTTNTAKLIGLDNVDFSKWNQQNSAFSLPAEQLKSGISIVTLFEKETQVAAPVISIDTLQYNVQVKDSDLEKEIDIAFKVVDTDNVRVYIDGKADTMLVPASNGFVKLYFQKDFNEVYGTKKIVLVAESAQYGTGNSVTALITFTAVNDYPSITEINYPQSIDIPSFSDFNIEYKVNYTSFAASTIDVDLLLKDNSRITLFRNLTPNGEVSINIKSLRERFVNWAGSNNVTLIFKPFNRGGVEELIGNEYEVRTELAIPSIQLDENIFSSAIFESFREKLSVIEPEKESKYLTHLANFGNDEQIIISSWENDDWTLSEKETDAIGNIKVKNKVDSLILKLYTPLNANISENSTLWITKLMANPLIETIVLTEQDDIKCPPIKGPNFSLNMDFVSGQSTNYESLDNLILSGSVNTSTQLVATYLSSSLVNTDDLNIEYVSGSEYLWNNFVHFSSAKERLENFHYKVKLIELYDQLILSASTDSGANVSGSIYGYDLYPSTYTGSIASTQEVNRQKSKRDTLIAGFDGLEKFLYTSSSYSLHNSSSITWPYSGSVRVNSSSPLVTNNYGTGWYDNIITLAEDYDIENPNYVLNNIPEFIVNNENNDQFLLFFTMIGQHFDNIYYHTKSIEKSRGLGYKSKDGISDKLLFDVLKSFNWDAKNLAADTKLWSYTFGNENGETELNPAKQRTYEVWRRIVNNLPYLLKHKGTRRGVYALLSCYGIPSSNLSILEFGGPEVTETTKSKLIYDNITTALKMVSGSIIQMDWKNTDKGVKPNTVELFIKPTYPQNASILSGSNWNVTIETGSTDSQFGKVIFNYSGSNQLTSSLLPIFNDNFFGIAVSVSGSTEVKLDVRQSDKDRTIFEQSVSTSSIVSNWETDTTLTVGGLYSGSLDEFRLWSAPLDTQRFYEHVSFPEMINGNDIESSTNDLYFRLDFEYPKNLAQTSSLINVDTNIYYPTIQINPSSSLKITRNILEETGSIGNNVILSTNSSALFTATAVGFPSVSEYPFQFEVIDRSVVLEVPDLGAGRYSTNKIRFESQELVSDLSSKSRATKKAFDQSPTDSNRVGLFFSPTKELNIDIAKSFGGINLDNYIGDPSDRYKAGYKSLDKLRNYYFQRFDGRDIYAYINLIKLYEKSMFEDIKKMLPARVKATTGLLIEPHILERSKHQHTKPIGEHNVYEVSIPFGDELFSAEYNQYEVSLDTETEYTLSGESNQKETTIDADLGEHLNAENYQQTASIDAASIFTLNSEYYQTQTIIDAGLGDSTIVTEIDLANSNIIVGQTDLENVGFGIYAESGSAIRTYYDNNGTLKKERVRVQLIRETKTREYVYLTGSVGVSGLYNKIGTDTYVETKLNIQPFSGSTQYTSSNVNIEVIPLNGYLKTHYRNTSDLTRGLQNSFYNGSKNTAATTLDGTPPVETFSSNPNTLRVNKAGRDSSEPILEVE